MKKTLLIAATLLAFGSATSAVMPAFAQQNTNANGEAAATGNPTTPGPNENINGGARGCATVSGGTETNGNLNRGCTNDNGDNDSSKASAAPAK
jgi:hypothetical protein